MASNHRTAAFTVFQERISPVFDVAQTALVVEVGAAGIVSRRLIDLGGLTLETRLDRLRACGVEELICGAMSRPAFALASGSLSSVHAFVAGDLEAVIEAWLKGRLASPAFGMPGCGRPRRCCRRQGGAGRPCATDERDQAE
jgi:predicted Fe-Mo cluster-binding NifX family protein